MKVTRDKTENCQAFLTIEMEPAEAVESMEEAYRHLAQRATIPGFRRGKAPRGVAERYIGKARILEEALNHLLPETYEKAIKEQEIKAIAEPNLEVTQTDPVIFKAIVPLSPVTELGDYHAIKIAPEPVPATEDNVNTVMDGLRHEHATWEPVERPVNFGDLVVMDIDSSVGAESFIKRQGVQYQVIRDTPFPAPGFAEQIAGIKKGEDKEFKLVFPADYPKSEYAGKEASFKVKVTEVKEEKLPELNDELAKQVSPDFETLDALRERVSTNLKFQAEEKARTDFEEKVIEAVVGLAKVEFPPVLAEAEIDNMLSERARRLQMGGKGMDEYLKSIKKTVEQLREETKPIAEKRITRSLVLGKVAEVEKIEASDAEADAEIEKMTKGTAEGADRDKLHEFLNTPRSRESIKDMVMTRKTIERLVEIARKESTVQTEQKEEKK